MAGVSTPYAVWQADTVGVSKSAVMRNIMRGTSW